MKIFQAQQKFDFEQPDWSKDPVLYIIHEILEQRLDIIKIAKSCFPNIDQNNCIGRTGITLEQAVRCAIYKQIKRLKYRELSIHTADSKMGIVFMKMNYGQSFSHQALQHVIKKITADALNKINIAIGQLALDEGIDTGKKMRIDSTAFESNIHYPTSCSLLWDCIRVSNRYLKKVKKLIPEINTSPYSVKTAKKLNFSIVNTKRKDKRIPLFKKMLRIQRKFIKNVQFTVDQLKEISFDDPKTAKEMKQNQADLELLLPKMQQIHDVAHRWEILGEKVEVEDKLFSIFEDHTDCIAKGNRDTVFGHKVNFTSGTSNIIFDVIIKKGNPNDKTYFSTVLDNLNENYNLIPRDVSTDGGYASGKNLNDAKERGIKNIVFTKAKGKMQNIVSSKRMETMLKKWRSGMESVISNLVRGLDSRRCCWKGFESFQSFVLWNVITYNLKMIALSILRAV